MATGSMSPDSLLRAAFEAAIDAAQPATCVPRFLPEPPGGRTIVVGAGKAAAAMALALDRNWVGDVSGLVVTAQGHAVQCPRIEVLEASHPVPAATAQRAAEQTLRRVSGLGADDLVICLLSGGGSALLPLPAHGLTLDEKQAITRQLLRSGATIGEFNCVRRHLSRIKGGRLAAACHPARVVTLAISDVPGDDPADIASGPTVADPTTCENALAVLDRYRIEASALVRSALRSGEWESVKPGDLRLARAEYRMVARPQWSLEAAARLATERGVAPLILSDRLEGEARVVAREMAGMVAALMCNGRSPRPPCVLISGGETTVTVRGAGRGGRNVEFLLALGIALGKRDNVFALAGDTDGVDGMEPVAGAIWRPDSLARATALGLDPQRFLDDNDAHAFFEALGDAVVTGPTRTNVNDFRAILVLPEGPTPG
jgi:hydroxypyruvate reductase